MAIFPFPSPRLFPYLRCVRVIVAASAGFCWGVRRAVEKARAIARESKAPIYTDGPLIHNDEMMARLREQGIAETDDPDSLEQGLLMIRAHGIPPDRRAKLSHFPTRLVDATCPDVAKIQGLIRKHARAGCHIVIFGDPGHAEVVGLLGYAEGKGHVVNSVEDIRALPEMQHVCAVSQSTQFPPDYEAIVQGVVRRFPDALVLDTICKSTKNRQRELLEIARKVDAIVVVGGAHSANTVRLVKLARALKPTFHIQAKGQLDPEEFASFTTVGLTAGASTPSFIIADVRKALESI